MDLLLLGMRGKETLGVSCSCEDCVTEKVGGIESREPKITFIITNTKKFTTSYNASIELQS
jgi:hypothetical protein